LKNGTLGIFLYWLYLAFDADSSQSGLDPLQTAGVFRRRGKPRAFSHGAFWGGLCQPFFRVLLRLQSSSIFSVVFWLAGSFLLMLMYEAWWIRYFCSGRTLADFYGSFWGIPVAGASLPVLAFLLLAIYGRVLWLGLSAILLGIGHIGIHLRHRRSLSS